MFPFFECQSRKEVLRDNIAVSVYLTHLLNYHSIFSGSQQMSFAKQQILSHPQNFKDIHNALSMILLKSAAFVVERNRCLAAERGYHLLTKVLP